MAACEELQVRVYTSPGPTCGTFSQLRLTLIGSLGETPPISLNESGGHLVSGSVFPVLLRPEAPLGELLLVRLRLQARPGLPDLGWRCSQVEVRGAGLKGAGLRGSGVQVFLCDRWLRACDGDVELHSGKMCLMEEETEEKLRQHRRRQLQLQQKNFRWRCFIDGAPHGVDLRNLSELGPNLSYTHHSPPVNLHHLKAFSGRTEAWRSFAELEALFSHIANQNSIAKFIQAHWREDWFFGYQALNGSNPLLLRQVGHLPPHLSVTDDMLRPFLPEGSSLEAELQKGAVFLLDYEVLDGLPANVVGGRQTYLSAPLCLLHLDQRGQLLPIAIQLQQTPGPLNPVFLPSDAASDWLLAKVWVRSADFQVHQMMSHYLRGHMTAELCCVATLRHLAHRHPLHQLLMPHLRTSLQINIQARASLLATNGIFDKAVGAGLAAVELLLPRATARLSYRSLCPPDDSEDRGLTHLNTCHYREDAGKIWTALHRFVTGWLDLCYRGDEEVQRDSELQLWINDINTHGFSHNSGFPQSFHSKADLAKFVTMIVFSCSALHAAVNFSQLDFALWMPNCPAAMFLPPPQAKGVLSEEDILSFLPDAASTCSVLTVLTLLSQPSTDYVPLCHYREAVFGDGAPRRLLLEVQAELAAISDDITERNRHLELPYPYLNPAQVENSVAI